MPSAPLSAADSRISVNFAAVQTWPSLAFTILLFPLTGRLASIFTLCPVFVQASFVENGDGLGAATDQATAKAESKTNTFLSLKADGVSRKSSSRTAGSSSENQGTSSMRSSFSAHAGV